MASGDKPVEITQFKLPLSWIGSEELEILFANQFLVLLDDQGEAIITVGQMTQPAVVGSGEEIRKQLERMAYVPVKPVARFALTTERIHQLIDVLNKTLENQNTVRAALAKPKDKE